MRHDRLNKWQELSSPSRLGSGYNRFSPLNFRNTQTCNEVSPALELGMNKGTADR